MNFIQSILFHYHFREDISLGGYLIQKIKNQNEYCFKCHGPKLDHWTILYGPECFVRINLIKNESGENKLKLKLELQREDSSIINNTLIDLD